MLTLHLLFTLADSHVKGSGKPKAKQKAQLNLNIFFIKQKQRISKAWFQRTTLNFDPSRPV